MSAAAALDHTVCTAPKRTAHSFFAKLVLQINTVASSQRFMHGQSATHLARCLL